MTVELHDELLDLVPTSLFGRSGSVLYSGRAAFVAPAPLYLLGLNPGGDPVVQAQETIEDSIRMSCERPEVRWSAYVDEPWRGRQPGTTAMQLRVTHLLNEAGLDPRTTPAANVVFVRTSREAALAQEKKQALLTECWTFHAALIEALKVRVVACMGGTAGRWAREMLGANELVDRWSEQNNRRWTSEAHVGRDGVQVLTLTHPSVAAWNTPAADPSPLVRAALERAANP